jgi:hypothetical protein
VREVPSGHGYYKIVILRCGTHPVKEHVLSTDLGHQSHDPSAGDLSFSAFTLSRDGVLKGPLLQAGPGQVQGLRVLGRLVELRSWCPHDTMVNDFSRYVRLTNPKYEMIFDPKHPGDGVASFRTASDHERMMLVAKHRFCVHEVTEQGNIAIDAGEGC